MTKRKHVDLLSAWWLDNAVPVKDSPLGRDYAIALMQAFVNRFPNEESVVVVHYLNAWNAQNTPPLPKTFLTSLLDLQPQKTQKPKPVDPERFAIRLFDTE